MWDRGNGIIFENQFQKRKIIAQVSGTVAPVWPDIVSKKSPKFYLNAQNILIFYSLGRSGNINNKERVINKIWPKCKILEALVLKNGPKVVQNND